MTEMKEAFLHSGLVVRKGEAFPTNTGHSSWQRLLPRRNKRKAKPDGRVRSSFRLDPGLHRKLKLAAVQTGRPQRELVSAALDKYLEDVARELDRNCPCLQDDQSKCA